MNCGWRSLLIIPQRRFRTYTLWWTQSHQVPTLAIPFLQRKVITNIASGGTQRVLHLRLAWCCWGNSAVPMLGWPASGPTGCPYMSLHPCFFFPRSPIPIVKHFYQYLLLSLHERGMFLTMYLSCHLAFSSITTTKLPHAALLRRPVLLNLPDLGKDLNNELLSLLNITVP